MTSRTILLVDDDAFTCDILARHLAARGIEVRTAKDGVDALEKIADWRPDLVVTDFQMPVMSGPELIARLRREYPELPVVLISGEPREAPDGTLAFYLKGPSMMQLAERIEECFRERAEREPRQGPIPISLRSLIWSFREYHFLTPEFGG